MSSWIQLKQVFEDGGNAGVAAVPGGGLGVPDQGVLHHSLLLHTAATAVQDQREEVLESLQR